MSRVVRRRLFFASSRVDTGYAEYEEYTGVHGDDGYCVNPR